MTAWRDVVCMHDTPCPYVIQQMEPEPDEMEAIALMVRHRILFYAVVAISGLIAMGWSSTGFATDAQQGQVLYAKYCAACHGPQGKGDGPAASSMKPRPRNHTDGTHMNALSDEHLRKVIAGGGQAVKKSPLMPPWEGVLTSQQIGAVIRYVRTLAVPAYQP